MLEYNEAKHFRMWVLLDEAENIFNPSHSFNATDRSEVPLGTRALTQVRSCLHSQLSDTGREKQKIPSEYGLKFQASNDLAADMIRAASSACPEMAMREQ